MNLFILGIFVGGPLVVAQFLIRQQEKADRNIEVFNAVRPRRIRR